MLSKKSVKPLRYGVHACMTHNWCTCVCVCVCMCVCMCVHVCVFMWLLFIIKKVADYNFKQPHIVLLVVFIVVQYSFVYV